MITGILPDELKGSHFDTFLKSYIIYQYFNQRVIQPLILKQLSEWGIDISSGQISNIFTRDKDGFHKEKDELLSKEICKKQGLSFWEFLCDRISKRNQLPYLPDLLSC